jgi:diguanylate cyclase (GGDEF)-like protein/PAS domain S-box-containing protein
MPRNTWPASFVDAMPIAVAQLDAQGRVVRGNAALATLFEIDAGELIGFDLHDAPWPTPGSGMPGTSVLDRFLAGHQVDEVVHLHPDSGTCRELRVRATPAGDPGEHTGGSLIIAEVPPALASQLGVGRDAEAYRLLADHLADIVLVSEGDVVTWASPSIRRILGHDPRTVLGKPVAELVHPQDERPATVTSQSPIAGIRHRLLTADGHYRWFDTNVSGRFDQAGRLIAQYAISRDIDERIRLEQLVDANEQRFQMALDASPDGFAIFQVERGPDGAVAALRLLSINAAGAAGFNANRSALVGRDLLDFYPVAKVNGVWADLLAAVETGRPQHSRVETVETASPGVLDGVQVRLDADMVMSTWRNVTEKVRSERLLAQAYQENAEVRATLATALDATSDGFLIFELDRDQDGAVTGMRTIHANAAATEGVGLRPEDVLGRDPRDFYPQFVAAGTWDKALASVTEMRPRSNRVHLLDTAGQWTRSLDNTLAPVGADRVVLTFRDVTTDERARREQEDNRRRAEHAATHDPLTGLANRVLLRSHIEEALKACEPHELVGVVFCDLNGFKQVNDTFGHATGDDMLKAIAQRLQRLLRRHDVAARLAGDEFVMLLRHLPAGWTTDEFMIRTTNRLQKPIWVEGALLTPSASLGIVLADPRQGPDSDRDPDALLAAADRAMYATKAAARPALDSSPHHA